MSQLTVLMQSYLDRNYSATSGGIRLVRRATEAGRVFPPHQYFHHHHHHARTVACKRWKFIQNSTILIESHLPWLIESMS
jgi:hypothetical protein